MKSFHSVVELMLSRMDQRLKDLLQRKAEVELRETELRKKQSLEQFREWLKKHPYLKRTRQGK